VSIVQLKKKNIDNFVTQFENTKFEPTSKDKIVKQLVSICRREHFTYDDLRYVYKRVREHLVLKPNKQPKRLPEVMTDEELARLFNVIDTANIMHSILFRLMYYTGCRVSELCNIQLIDVDTDSCKIKINQGKGSKDRFVLFPDQFKLTLKAYMNSVAHQSYLFESKQHKQFTARRIQQLCKNYVKQAEIGKEITPHSFRHQCLTYLTSKGLTDSQIQLVSGHSKKNTLAIYQHLSLESVEASYKEAFLN